MLNECVHHMCLHQTSAIKEEEIYENTPAAKLVCGYMQALAASMSATMSIQCTICCDISANNILDAYIPN